MIHDVPVGAGDRLCEDTHGVVGSWVSFGITCGMLLIASSFIYASLQPIFQPKLQGEFQAGLALLALGGIFAAIGTASFLLARHRSRSRVFLHENGIVLMKDAKLHFVPYENCNQFTVQMYDPSRARVGESVVRAGLSILTGNAAGAGAAIGAARRRGYVAFQVDSDLQVTLEGISMSQLEIVARHASRACGRDVVHYFGDPREELEQKGTKATKKSTGF